MVDGEPNIAIQAGTIHIPKSSNTQNLKVPNDAMYRFESEFKNQVLMNFLARCKGRRKKNPDILRLG